MFNIKRLSKNVHLTLSADLSAALSCKEQDPTYVNLLFYVFIIAFGALFVTEGNITHLMFIYLVTPVVFAPFKFKLVYVWGLPLISVEKFSLYNLFRNITLCRTPLFFAVLIYGVDKAYLSYLYPEPNLGYLHIFFYYLLAPLLVYIITVIRLCVDTPNFYFRFFRVMGPIAALNALISIYFFIKSLPSPASLGSVHMTAIYGAAIGHNPNLDCLVYALYTAGMIITLILNFSSKDFYLTIPAAIILLVAIFFEQSRATMGGIIISLSVLAFLSQKVDRIYVFFVMVALLTSFLIFSYFYLPNGIASYFLRGESYRAEVWMAHFKYIIENPIIGYGDRTVREVVIVEGEKLFHAHSILLSSWLRGGLLGLGCMVYIAIFGVRRGYAYAKAYGNFVPLCVFVVVCVDGIFNSELKVWQAGWEWAGYWLAIALTLGADAALRNKAFLPEPKPYCQKVLESDQ